MKLAFRENHDRERIASKQQQKKCIIRAKRKRKSSCDIFQVKIIFQ